MESIENFKNLFDFFEQSSLEMEIDQKISEILEKREIKTETMAMTSTSQFPNDEKQINQNVNSSNDLIQSLNDLITSMDTTPNDIKDNVGSKTLQEIKQEPKYTEVLSSDKTPKPQQTLNKVQEIKQEPKSDELLFNSKKTLQAEMQQQKPQQTINKVQEIKLGPKPNEKPNSSNTVQNRNLRPKPNETPNSFNIVQEPKTNETLQESAYDETINSPNTVQTEKLGPKCNETPNSADKVQIGNDRSDTFQTEKLGPKPNETPNSFNIVQEPKPNETLKEIQQESAYDETPNSSGKVFSSQLSDILKETKLGSKSNEILNRCDIVQEKLQESKTNETLHSPETEKQLDSENNKGSVLVVFQLFKYHNSILYFVKKHEIYNSKFRFYNFTVGLNGF